MDDQDITYPSGAGRSGEDTVLVDRQIEVIELELTNLDRGQCGIMEFELTKAVLTENLHSRRAARWRTIAGRPWLDGETMVAILLLARTESELAARWHGAARAASGRATDDMVPKVMEAINRRSEIADDLRKLR